MESDPSESWPPNEMHRQVLLDRLAEIHHLIGADLLQWPGLGKDDCKDVFQCPEVSRNDRQLRRIGQKLDLVLKSVTGVSARDRALVALDDAAGILAASVKGDVFTPGAKASYEGRAFIDFCRTLALEFPRFPDGLVKVATVGRCMVAYARALHPGRPSDKAFRSPSKAEAFRDLAVHVGLISIRMGPEAVTRIVNRARRNLARPRTATQKGGHT